MEGSAKGKDKDNDSGEGYTDIIDTAYGIILQKNNEYITEVYNAKGLL